MKIVYLHNQMYNGFINCKINKKSVYFRNIFFFIKINNKTSKKQLLFSGVQNKPKSQFNAKKTALNEENCIIIFFKKNTIL